MAVSRRNRTANDAHPMNPARVRRLVPRDVKIAAFSEAKCSGVILSRNGASFRVNFTDRDAQMTDAALRAVVFQPAMHSLRTKGVT